MSAEKWRPSPDDQHMATEAYVHYASGVAIINDPEGLQPVHALEINEENLVPIVIVARELMLAGIHDVIRYANPVGIRESLSRSEDHYDDALVHMLATVDKAYTNRDTRSRLVGLNKHFRSVHPAPMRKRNIYNYFCHSRYPKIHLTDLLDGFQPSPILEDAVRLKNSTLANA